MLKQTQIVYVVCLLAMALAGGCGYSQTVKDGWKGTRSLWYEYANVPAKVDYSQTGEMDNAALALASRMLEIDTRLAELERVMSNADKPPTQEWLTRFFQQFPWLGGFAGVRADGQILGEEPAVPLKPTDYAPLLEVQEGKDKRALRSYVQNTPLGPEVYLAVPLYNADQFLGVIACHFDMRALLKFAIEPEDLLVFTPYTVLWSGKYDFSATPASTMDWEKTIASDVCGVCSNTSGELLWTIRYLADQPLIFAVPAKGTFPDGRGEVGSFADQEPAVRQQADRSVNDKASDVSAAHRDSILGSSHEDVGHQLDESGIELAPEPVRVPSPFGPY